MCLHITGFEYASLKYAYTYLCMHAFRMDGWMGRWMGGWMDVQMDGVMDGLTDGRPEGWMDGYVYAKTSACKSLHGGNRLN